MTTFLAFYFGAIGVLRTALFWIAVIVAVLALADWLVRTRRISPFSAFARFVRKTVDPLIAPMERRLVRAGGTPSAAPWWVLAIVVVGGMVLIYLLDFIGRAVLMPLADGMLYPGALPRLLITWVFQVLELALLVRVFSSWFNISPYSRWIRWSYVLTDWIVDPLRRVVPTLGMIDVTPLVAWVLLQLGQMVVLSFIPM